ncbi:LysR family transcriptional regulator [Sphingobium phenoxybenzoativorans]|uniref:LysR family transcriptional regulator n=1 Tax=Sphingobium phenoxybenzoativorans TaxID=1592790 RepID=A0A975KB59_9SPHN|nr:LysR substrate-binding domain-containing protein [Sphingobium phenoxybenzoativorans]QUT07817.1 LysR family transcriptional regulator [Sphingobium phenoxybenzoativorans]
MVANHSWSIKEIDLTSLRLFAATVEEGTLARAAEREHIAISAISRRISDLEWRCGVTLLERRDRGVVPSAAGQILVNQIRDLLDLLQRMVLDMEAIRGGTRGHIRVHAHMSATSGLLPGKIAEFVAANPGVDVELDEFTSIEVIHSVRTGTADIGLVSGTVDGGDLHLIPWEIDELVAILPPGHALAERSSLQLSDMLGEYFVGMQRDSALLSLYRHQAMVLGKTLKERAHATSFESVRKMVSVGLGVAILPAVAAHPFVEELGINVRPLKETWAHRPLMLCVRDPAQLLAATRLLVQHLTGEAPRLMARA